MYLNVLIRYSLSNHIHSKSNLIAQVYYVTETVPIIYYLLFIIYILDCVGVISISTYNVYLNLTIYIFIPII